MTSSNTMPSQSANDMSRSWWFLNDKGEMEKVEHERFYWVAIYKDGTMLYQFENTEEWGQGIYHRFAEIEWEKLIEIHVKDMVKGTMVVLRGSMDLQFFMLYRNRKTMTVNAGVTQGDPIVIRFAVFGWKDRKTGATSYHYMMPDGAMIASHEDIRVE